MSADHDTGQARTQPLEASVSDTIPVVIRTYRFGDLDFDHRQSRFEGRVDWDGETIELLFNVVENHDLESELAVAEHLWDAQAEWAPKVEAFATQELLSLKNDQWLRGDEEPVTAEQFKAYMEMVAISFSPEGGFGFRHDAGNLFGDHGIEVSGSLKDGLTSASLF